MICYRRIISGVLPWLYQSHLLSVPVADTTRTNWHKLPKADYGIPPYARYLQGIRICLDPGHGGQGHLPEYKRGPTGLREAEVNLRVAFYLRDFLSQAGAI